ncbi:MAG TPA: hypothetical protein VFL16_14715, partial [Steroidobacteraceae bacterium]|nr:hypothetical protein [Steroidobacteraceae bacterium]
MNGNLGRWMLGVTVAVLGCASAQTPPAPTPNPLVVEKAPIPQDTPIETKNLAPGIYVLFGRGGN